MKVICSTLRYYPAIGGAETVLQQVCERLTKRGFEFKILATTAKEAHDIFKPSPKNTAEEESFVNDVKVIKSPISNIPFRPKLAKMLDIFSVYGHGVYSNKQFKHLLRDNYDLIHSSPFPSTHNYYSFLAAKIRRKPVVFFPQLHLGDIYHSHRKSLFFMMKHASATMANTKFEKEFYIKQGVSPKKIFVTGVGVDPWQYKKPENLKLLTNKGKKQYITFLGRKEEYKGIETILKALRLLIKKHPDLYFVCAGPDTPYSNKLFSSVSTKIKNHLINLSTISEEEKNEILANADVFVCPSTAESFGIVYLEAWMHEKPVIGVNIGAIPSVITNKKDGLLIEPNNYQELAEKIDYLLGNDNKAHNMGVNGKQKVLENYTWDIIADKWKKIFETVV